MLTPEELDLLPRNVSALYAELEEEIISDMARRIVKTDMVTDTAMWQMIRLEAIGGCQEDIFNRLSQKTGKSKKELKKMFNEAVTKTYDSESAVYEEAGQSPVPLKENNQLQRIINAGLRKTNNLFDNLTRTTAKTATGQFERVLDTAYMQIASGAFDYNTAIRGAIKELAKGIESIRYPSGHTDKLDVAVRRASLTGVSQTCGRMSEAIADEMDCDLVLVSAHFGARPEHAVWQGKVFSRSGDSEKYPDFIKSTGYGTGAGLKGWNCRHDFGAYIDGVSINPYSSERLKEMKNRTVEYDGEVMSEYDASQKQRAMERSIRKTKRELAGYDGAIKASDNPSLKEALQVDFDRKSVLLKKQEAKLKDFTDTTILRRDRAREQVPAHFDTKLNKTVAFNKSISQKAVSVHRRNQQFITDMNEAGINTIGFDKFAGDSEDLKRIKNAHLRLRSEFPEEFEELTIRYGFSNDKTEFAWYDIQKQEIVYNKNVFDYHKKMKSLYKETVLNNFSPKGTDYIATVYHEFGHRYSYFHNINNKKIIDEILQENGKGRYTKGKAVEYISQRLSIYATKDMTKPYSETIAECFAEWYNSSEPREFCKQYLRKAGLIK